MGNMTNIPYMLPSHVHHLALFISIYDPVIFAEVIHEITYLRNRI
jgi:hypothetical protein